LNPDGRFLPMTIETDGTDLEVPLPRPFAVPGGVITLQFVITGDRPRATLVDVPGEPVNPSTDRVQLSTDKVFGGDTFLTRVSHTTNLAGAGMYTETLTVTISAAQPPGTYFLFLQTDEFSQVSEENENNNVATSIQITVQ
jgi:hypothetical protein